MNKIPKNKKGHLTLYAAHTSKKLIVKLSKLPYMSVRVQNSLWGPDERAFTPAMIAGFGQNDLYRLLKSFNDKTFKRVSCFLSRNYESGGYDSKKEETMDRIIDIIKGGKNG